MNRLGKLLLKTLSVSLLSVSLLACSSVQHHKKTAYHTKAKAFATLPDGLAFPEGIARNPSTGDIYVSTFSFAGNNTLLRYDKTGKLLAQIDFAKTPLLGLAFNTVDKKVYICNTGDLVGDKSRIQRVDGDFVTNAKVEDVAAIPHIGAPGSRTVNNPDGSKDTIIFGDNAAAPNAMTFNKAGDLLISDSFQGAVFKIDNAANCKKQCAVTTVIHDSLLATPGFPPFGANGLALNADESKLYIANTGDDRILSLDMATKELNVFAESINGADGLAMDANGYLWAAANQADKIVMFESTGKVHGKLGIPGRVNKDGSHSGLLFPASLVIADGTIYVTNLAIPLTPAKGDEVEEAVSKYTISAVKIPQHK
ncbi:SMP-30/gluconolactonase/LRE family protein [uncultured Desulfobacter sp.]|uniref:SMP-30/gluconolactonase/LRE family protein n=1 Tax=uncultured Desulfobacter sp. TaxID=240139 RepID=UPI0029F59680|nr:SMP-30/gluconolactonase/LRE family protein [uncultured Desulfobacter sp.]